MHLSPSNIIWYTIWLKPAIDYGRGEISFWGMIWAYIVRAWIIFAVPALLFALYIYNTTPDVAWARKNPLPNLEEQARLKTEDKFNPPLKIEPIHKQDEPTEYEKSLDTYDKNRWHTPDIKQVMPDEKKQYPKARTDSEGDGNSTEGYTQDPTIKVQ